MVRHCRLFCIKVDYRRKSLVASKLDITQAFLSGCGSSLALQLFERVCVFESEGYWRIASQTTVSGVSAMQRITSEC